MENIQEKYLSGENKTQEGFLRDYIFIDEKGYMHKVSEENKIGEGGQGFVYRTDNKNILIKRSFIKRKNEMKIKVNKIKSLGLSKLNFALPILNLKAHQGDNMEGYIMRIMDDMEKISVLTKSSFTDEENLYKYYFEKTGGIRKRLEVLKKIAYNLYSIHSRGIVYGDISLCNIFISKNPDQNEAWFIDCDNMDYWNEIDYALGSEHFVSPEIRKSLPPYNLERHVNTIENDIYAYANLFFYTVFSCDPFLGSIDEYYKSKVEGSWDSEEDDWDFEEDGKNFPIDEKIELGMVSWVGEGDIENKPIYGFSPIINKIITKELKDLLNRTLGKDGREHPKNRPSMRLWYEEINDLLNLLIKYECGHEFYSINEKCPKCKESKEDYFQIKINYENNKKEKIVNMPKLLKDNELTFQIKYCDLGIGKFSEKELVGIEFSKMNEKFFIRNNLKFKIKFIEENSEDSISINPNRREQIFGFNELEIDLPEYQIKMKISG